MCDYVLVTDEILREAPFHKECWHGIVSTRPAVVIRTTLELHLGTFQVISLQGAKKIQGLAGSKVRHAEFCGRKGQVCGDKLLGKFLVSMGLDTMKRKWPGRARDQIIIIRIDEQMYQVDSAV